MNENLDVGVVIPTFNSGLTIERALQSVLNQTLLPSHIVVVDNGSTDHTIEVIERVRHDAAPRITTVLLNTNTGPGNARNVAWDLIDCPLVAFLDADDSWHPEKLRLQVNLIARHPNHRLFGHRTRIASQDLGDDPVVCTNNEVVSYFSLNHFLIRNRISTPTVMVRASVKERFNVDPWFAEDYGLWTSIVSAGHAAVVSSLPLTTLYKAPWGASGLSSHLHEMYRGELTVLSRLRSAGRLPRVKYEASRLWIGAKYLRRRLRYRYV